LALGGAAGDRARVVALQYVDGGADAGEGADGRAGAGAPRSPPGGQLLSVDVAVAGTGAFGDDLAIECLAAAYGRDVYVVRWRTASALCLLTLLSVLSACWLASPALRHGARGRLRRPCSSDQGLPGACVAARMLVSRRVPCHCGI